jgi:hypothetical protein
LPSFPLLPYASHIGITASSFTGRRKNQLPLLTGRKRLLIARISYWHEQASAIGSSAKPESASVECGSSGISAACPSQQAASAERKIPTISVQIRPASKYQPDQGGIRK